MVTQEQQSIIDHAQLQKINGWQHIKVKGTPYECGFQEGYLLADEYKDALRVYKFMTLETFGMTYEWFAEQALKLHRDKIPTRWFEELRGMAEGLTAAGIPTTTDDMIAWNELDGDHRLLVAPERRKIMSRPLMKTHRKEHCSAIVATGSATVDGKPYLGHESFDEFWSGQYFNICKRVEPDDGYAFIMQASAPCMLSSMTDFYVTAAGLNITETTLAGFDRYDDAGMPEWVRIRDAVQYAATIDEFVERLNKGNNGGYANAWLIADHNTGEIAASSRAWNSRASSAPSTARTSAATPCSTRASATWNARTTASTIRASRPAPVASAGWSSSISTTARSTWKS